VSNRGNDWTDFSMKVLKHVEEYTVPQYGDAPNDQVENWTPQECMRAIGKYAARHGRNARKGQESVDCLKIAHFAQMAYDKMGGA